MVYFLSTVVSMVLTLSAYAGQTHASNGASKAPMVSPNYREEAERIVAEEKAHGEKMPVYDVGTCSISNHSDVISGSRRVQVGRKDGRRCILKRVQGYRAEDRTQGCGQGRPEVRTELVTGEVYSLFHFGRCPRTSSSVLAFVYSSLFLNAAPRALATYGIHGSSGFSAFVFDFPISCKRSHRTTFRSSISTKDRT